MPVLKREVEFSKELDDVAKLLVELVKDVKDKKELTALAAENLPGLMSALDGVDQMDDELKENRKVALSTLGGRLGELTDALLGE